VNVSGPDDSGSRFVVGTSEVEGDISVTGVGDTSVIGVDVGVVVVVFVVGVVVVGVVVVGVVVVGVVDISVIGVGLSVAVAGIVVGAGV